MTINAIHPSKELVDAAEIEAGVLDDQGYGAADIYYSENGSAVVITDTKLVEVYPDPDEASGYVADTHDVRR